MTQDVTYRLVDGAMVLGKLRKAFIHNCESYHLTNIGIYADGLIYCWEWVDLEGFRQKLASGWVTTILPENAKVSIQPFFDFTATEVLYRIPEAEFFKEVADIIEELNSRPTSMHIFVAAKQKYWSEPSEENRRLMHATFERVPHHLKKFLLNARDYRHFEEHGLKTYRTVWDFNEP